MKDSVRRNDMTKGWMGGIKGSSYWWEWCDNDVDKVVLYISWGYGSMQ